MRGDSGVAGEGRVVGIPKFYSWGKCTMPLTNINSDWMSNASSGLCIILLCYIGLVYVIAWFAVVFGINSTSNAESNCTRRSRVQFTAL